MRQIFFSIDQIDRPAKHQEIKDLYQRIPHLTRCLGCYTHQDGTVSRETSFCASVIHLPEILDVCKEYNQESILILDNCKGFLLYIETGEIVALGGDWREVKSVKGLDAYTVMNDRIYALVS